MPLLDPVITLLNAVTGQVVGQPKALSSVKTQFSIAVTGNGDGFTVKYMGSIDGDTYFPLGQTSTNGLFQVNGFPLLYLQGEVVTAPTSGAVTVKVLGA